jgi:hypothetical protein
MDDDAVWMLEERLWREGAATMEAALDAEAVMVFASPVGILAGADIAHSMEGAPRWTDIRMTERVIGRPMPDVVVLAYRGEGRRGDADPYIAYCSSVWRRDDGNWRLVQHQQTASD